jgi:hypothetical protein
MPPAHQLNVPIVDQIFLIHVELASKMWVKLGWVYCWTLQGADNPLSDRHVISCVFADSRAYDLIERPSRVSHSPDTWVYWKSDCTTLPKVVFIPSFRTGER